jgi:exodeoxyribonuclease-5
MAGEKIICLKNNREYGLFNGQILTMVEHDLMTPVYDKMQESKIYSVDCKVQDDNGYIRNIAIDMRFFTNEKLSPQQDAIANPFTFAYAITCHKSQGSQWDEVIVINESGYFKDLSDKWLYTAITRGAKKVWIIE